MKMRGVDLVVAAALFALCMLVGNACAVASAWQVDVVEVEACAVGEVHCRVALQMKQLFVAVVVAAVVVIVVVVVVVVVVDDDGDDDDDGSSGGDVVVAAAAALMYLSEMECLAHYWIALTAFDAAKTMSKSGSAAPNFCCY